MSQPMATSDRSREYSEYFASRRPASWAERFVRFWHARMLRAVVRRIPEFQRMALLEVGTGFGYFADACRKAGVAYSGVEMNAAQAEAMRAEGHDVVAGAIPPYPPGKPAQAVWMSHVLEHAETYHHASQMLIETHRRLDPGGVVVVICPDIHSWKAEFWGVDWSHGFPTTLRRVKQLMTETGFKVQYAAHHTATFTNPLLANLLAFLFSLAPITLLDWALERLTGRTLCYNFMTVYGWRQILVVGRKPPLVAK